MTLNVKWYRDALHVSYKVRVHEQFNIINLYLISENIEGDPHLQCCRVDTEQGIKSKQKKCI